MAKTQIETRDTFELAHFRFGQFDAKGREFGAQVQTCETTFRDMTPEEMQRSSYSYSTTPAGHYFTVTVQAQRGGINWGASQPAQHFKTLEERQQYIDRRLADMRKRTMRAVS